MRERVFWVSACALIAACGGNSVEPPPSLPAGVWAQAFGDSGNERTLGLAGDALGGVYAAFTFDRSLDVGGERYTAPGDGSLPLVIAGFDAQGAYRWSRNLKNAIGTIAADPSGNVHAAGAMYESLNFGGGPLPIEGGKSGFFASFASDGTHRWSKSVRDSISVASLTADGRGNVHATGSFGTNTDFDGEVDFGGGPLPGVPGGSVFVASFAADGAHRWSRAFSATSSQGGGSGDGDAIAADPNGNVYVAGSFRGTIDFGGGPRTSQDSGSLLLVSFGPDGSHRWSKAFPDAGNGNFNGLPFSGLPDRVSSIAVDARGNLYVTGVHTRSLSFGGAPLARSEGTSIFLASFTQDGAHRWSAQFGDGGIDSDSGHSVAADAEGNVYLSGRFDGTVSFGGTPLVARRTGPPESGNVFLASFLGDGTHRWSTSLGNADAYALGAATEAGFLWVAGSFVDSIAFDNLVLTSAGQRDAFLAKLSSDYAW